jgi:dolichol-phosphate mannosyltransferase
MTSSKALKLLTVVTAAHNEAVNLRPLVDRLSVVAGTLDEWEVALLVVDDGSRDNSIAVLDQLRGEGQPVGYLRLARNFGHQAALQAGVAAARGDAVLTMDADLQHPPECIPQMLQAFARGADVVHMVRNRPASGNKGRLSRLFYRIFAVLAHSEIVPEAADFRLLSRRVVEVLKQIPEREKFLRALIPSLGFRQTVLQFDEDCRQGGDPKYSFMRSLGLAQKALFDFSTIPLRLVFWAGTFLALTSFCWGIGHLVKKLVAWESITPGFTDIITSILFLSGCILAAIGILGRYLILILEQVRGRPDFIVMEKVEAGPLSSQSRRPRNGARILGAVSDPAASLRHHR